jgi:hypothetical protein
MPEALVFIDQGPDLDQKRLVVRTSPPQKLASMRRFLPQGGFKQLRDPPVVPFSHFISRRISRLSHVWANRQSRFTVFGETSRILEISFSE